MPRLCAGAANGCLHILDHGIRLPLAHIRPAYDAQLRAPASARRLSCFPTLSTANRPSCLDRDPPGHNGTEAFDGGSDVALGEKLKPIDGEVRLPSVLS